MSSIQVQTTIAVPPQKLWDYLQDISSHVDWMADATEIRFITDQHAGIGTAFECDTKVGPIKLTDKMTITEWVAAERMGVTHSGVVTGEGVFTLTPQAKTATIFMWEETLFYPIWLGGKIGATLSKPLLTFIWKRNLKKLKEKVENMP